MIVFFAKTAFEISKFAANFKWPDCNCEKCSRKMWGHGFVARYFESLNDSIKIKRLRCPVCGMVITFRPAEYYPAFRSKITSIYDAMSNRLKSGFWPTGFSRQRGWYWLKLFKASLFMSGASDAIDFLENRFLKEVHFFV